MALYFVETALRGGRSRKIGNSISNQYGNAPMIGSNNAGSWKVVARLFFKRMTIPATATAVLCCEGVLEGVANAWISDRRGAGRRFRHDACQLTVGATAPAGAGFKSQRRRPALAVADAAADAWRGGDAGRPARPRPGKAYRNCRVAGGHHGKIERRDRGVPRRGVQRSVLEGFEQSQARHGVRFAQRLV